MDVTQTLIQTKGYNAISFNHIAEQVGIKKPSIVHHYSSKADLGEAVVRRYRETFAKALDEFISDVNYAPMDSFDFYCQPYLDFGSHNEKVCLCVALAGEFLALPDSMQQEVQRFYSSHLEWLGKILKAGLQTGDFQFADSPADMAKLILNSLQGALLTKRSTGDNKLVIDTVALLKTKLVSG